MERKSNNVSSTLDSFVSVNRKKKTSEQEEPTKKEKESKAVTVSAKPDFSSSNSNFPSFNQFIGDLDTWLPHLKGFTDSDKMKRIYNFVSDAYAKDTCFPPKDLIFNAFKFVPWDDLKVVILGQDPYPNEGEAMGLSFSVPRNIKTPPSLKNIYKNLERDPNVQFKTPNHGDLTNWAKQGVLLLNTTLTVKHKVANSHQKTSGWVDFTDYVIKVISKEKKNVVFLLWGGPAKAKVKLIDKTKHCIIENIHPSPLAATSGDFGASKQFSETNDYLKKNGFAEIDWHLN